MNFKLNGTGAIGILAGLFGIGYGIYRDYKTNEMTKKIGLSVTQVESRTQIEVTQAIVDKAVQNAVDRQVAAAVSEGSEKVLEDIHNQIGTKVKAAVESSFDKLSEDVTQKISEQASEIDIYALRDKVSKEAEKKMLKKLDGSLDGVLSDFNGWMGRIQKIYGTVADSLAPRTSNNNQPLLRVNWDGYDR